MRQSGLQRQVLSLYRRFIRITNHRNMNVTVRNWIRGEFERYSHVNGKDIITIETLLRRASHQLEYLEKSDITNVTCWEPFKATTTTKPALTHKN